MMRAFSVVILIPLALLASCGGGSPGGSSTGGSSTGGTTPPPVQASVTVLHSFGSAPNDGAFPFGGLTMDTAGNLYGTTTGGGVTDNGTVFRLNSSNSELALYNFQGAPDGSAPSSFLARDSAGTLYGVTWYGGLTPCTVSLPRGCGTVFKLDSSGTETVLYRFDPQKGDGTAPLGIIPDGLGNFYGTTLSGGTSLCNCGTVFKLDSAGNETVLYTFTGQSGDGANPASPGDAAPGTDLILDSSGSLYGTTFFGGSLNCGNASGCGTVFKLSPDGHESVLYSFIGSPDGANPTSLVADNAGNFYGTTQNGGSSSNCLSGCGTVFKIDSSGHESVLYSFTGTTGTQNQDGSAPAWLLLDSTGVLYGITMLGGSPGSMVDCSAGCGTFFKVTSTGQETVLHSFNSMAGGAWPNSLLMNGGNNFYGTTMGGGPCSKDSDRGCGIVFQITLP